MSKAAHSLLWVTGFLLCIGLVMVFSASTYRSVDLTEHPYHWFNNQVLWLGIAVTLMTAVTFVDYRRLLRMWPYLFGMTVLGLVLVFVPGVGKRVNNSSRWLELAGYRCQPSELAKLTLIICIVGFLRDRRERINDFTGTFLPIVAGVILCFGLILLEPDLGTAVFVFALSVILMLIAGIKVRFLVFSGMLASPGLAVFATLKWDKIIKRFSSIGGGEKPFQVQHSLTALQSGGWFGKGLAQGTEKLGYLPEPHTDFIFSVFGEEFGYVGTVVVILLFAVFLISGLRIAVMACDFGGFLLAFGITFSIVFQAIFNIAVVAGTAPTKGISLPFVSYGGSGLVLALLGVGLILNVARVSARQDTLFGEVRDGVHENMAEEAEAVLVGDDEAIDPEEDALDEDVYEVDDSEDLEEDEEAADEEDEQYDEEDEEEDEVVSEDDEEYEYEEEEEEEEEASEDDPVYEDEGAAEDDEEYEDEEEAYEEEEDEVEEEDPWEDADVEDSYARS